MAADKQARRGTGDDARLEAELAGDGEELDRTEDPLHLGQGETPRHTEEIAGREIML